MVRRAEKRLAEEGAWGTVEYVVRRNGDALAEKFIDSLSEEERAKVGALLERMAVSGLIANRQKFKKVEGHIFEFKCFQIRIGCFQVQRSWLLTHAFVKKKDNWPKSELKRANEIRDEYLEDNPDEKQ